MLQSARRPGYRPESGGSHGLVVLRWSLLFVPGKRWELAPWQLDGVDGVSLRPVPLGRGDIWLVQGLCLWLQMHFLKYIWDQS